MTDEQFTDDDKRLMAFCIFFDHSCNDCPYQKNECDEFWGRHNKSPVGAYDSRRWEDE